MCPTENYTVVGMTCDHCVRSVTAEVSALPGVTDVAVDLSSGRVSVTSDGVDVEQLRGAVEEAGYTLTH